MFFNESLDLFSYFNKIVKEFVAMSKETVSEESIFYLSHLLANRSNIKDSYPETLAELRFMAIEGTSKQAIEAYREMGDRALFISGFFRGSLQHRIVNVDYYYKMGSMAYASLLTLIDAPFFAELSKHFVFFSEIIRDIAFHVRGSNKDLIAMYEEWLQTRDPKVACRLQRMGFNMDALIIA
ncbi:MAG: hypothetical protein VX278_02765 [Myxococcota bacterium]|nr:hypothetical protein [Myxococcota bacterium]